MNLLELMYKDPSKWAFAFQSYAQVTMLENHLNEPKDQEMSIMERSIFSETYCFVEHLTSSGQINSIEYQILTKWFQFMQNQHSVSADLIVYLRMPPETAYKRILERNDDEVDYVEKEYLKRLHELHDSWLFGSKYRIPDCPFIVVDAENHPSAIMNELEQILEKEFPVHEEEEDSVPEGKASSAPAGASA